MITYSLVDHLQTMIQSLQTENAQLRQMLGDQGAFYRKADDEVVTKLNTTQKLFVGLVVDVVENAHGSVQFLVRSQDRDSRSLQYGFAVDNEYRDKVDFMGTLDSILRIVLHDYYADYLGNRKKEID